MTPNQQQRNSGIDPSPFESATLPAAKGVVQPDGNEQWVPSDREKLLKAVTAIESSPQDPRDWPW